MTLLLADDRADLTSVHDERYVLGPLESPHITLNAADTHGCAWIAEVDGWDAPTVDTPVDRRPDGHGGYVGASSFAPLVLSVSGAVSAPSRAALRAAHGRLMGALLGDLTGFLRYTHLDEDPQRGAWTRITGQPKWRATDDRYAEFAFVLIAEDPTRTGAAVTVGPVRLMGTAAEGGLTAPFTTPLTFTGATASSVVGQLPNGGNVDAHARYVITGPVPEPVVQLSTGEYVRLTLTLGALDTAVVDTADGTVQVNGVNRYDAWGPGSVFPLIPGRVLDPATGEYTPGGAEVRLRSFTGGADPAAGLTVTTAPAWR